MTKFDIVQYTVLIPSYVQWTRPLRNANAGHLKMMMPDTIKKGVGNSFMVPDTVKRFWTLFSGAGHCVSVSHNVNCVPMMVS